MATLKGEASFGRLLRSFGASGYWQEFWARLRGLAAEDLPVRREFGISLEVLFERAFQWVRAGR
jgi:hypothetical protein